MSQLTLTPNIDGADDFYAELIEAHEGLGKAESDPELDPRGAAALLSAGAEALERAAALGDARAAELVPQVRADAARAE